jgi:exonuclease V gamma subunit
MPWALRGAEHAALTELARASLGLPAARAGRAWIDQAVMDVRRQAERLLAPAMTADAVVSSELRLVERRLKVDIDGQPCTLWLPPHQRPASGGQRWLPRKLHARDRVASWLEHLAVAYAARNLKPGDVAPKLAQTTRWVTRDRVWQLAPLGDDVDPECCLKAWMRARLQGLRTPLPFMPATSWAAAQDPTQRHIAWRGVTTSERRMPGDASDPHVALAWRGRHELIDDPAFTALAQQLFGRALSDVAHEEAL